MSLTYTTAAKAIRALGFKVSRTDGEIRVAWPNNESAAYYTDCPVDALGTAQLMVREDAPAADSVEVLGQTFEISSLTEIGTVDGVTYYECPVEGDESPLCTLEYDATGKPSLVCSDDWDLPESAAPAPAPAPAPAVETVNRAQAVEILMTQGDYSEAQAGIILQHARKWRKGGETVYSRDYVQSRTLDDSDWDEKPGKGYRYRDYPGQGEG
jgi:hypothetical protein